jgi:hypothetical protein
MLRLIALALAVAVLLTSCATAKPRNSEGGTDAQYQVPK